jgi:type VI protein secretion system component VasF
MATLSHPTEDGSTRTERRVNIRVFIYVIGLHVFAAFVMLLIWFGHRGA